MMRPSPVFLLVPLALIAIVLLVASLPIKMILGAKAAITTAIIGAVLGVIVVIAYFVMKYKENH